MNSVIEKNVHSELDRLIDRGADLWVRLRRMPGEPPEYPWMRMKLQTFLTVLTSDMHDFADVHRQAFNIRVSQNTPHQGTAPLHTHKIPFAAEVKKMFDEGVQLANEVETFLCHHWDVRRSATRKGAATVQRLKDFAFGKRAALARPLLVLDDKPRLQPGDETFFRQYAHLINFSMSADGERLRRSHALHDRALVGCVDFTLNFAHDYLRGLDVDPKECHRHVTETLREMRADARASRAHTNGSSAVTAATQRLADQVYKRMVTDSVRPSAHLKARVCMDAPAAL